MPSPFLRDVFSRVLGASLAPLALSGCGLLPMDTSGYQAPACTDGSLSVAGLQPSVIPDVIQLHALQNFGGGSNPMERLVSSDGTACKTATNQSVCATALAQVPASGFRRTCGQICSEYYLATSAGDEVKAYTTIETLRAFLGTIDTPQEALLLVFASGLDVSCGDKQRGAVRAVGTGFEVLATDGFACGQDTKVTRHHVTVSADGTLKETGTEVIEYGQGNCAAGRRPAGLRALESVDRRSKHDHEVGHFFALAARLEAASVRAFVHLHDELDHHGASAELKFRCLVSAAEEVEHAQSVAALAKRFGGTTPLAVVEDHPVRSLYDLALDNAVEGCVRETYGALLAHHQALHATDTEVRAVMTQIAADETRHAELSWHIHEWLLAQLTTDQRQTIHEAQHHAIDVLYREAAVEPGAALQTLAGMPDASTAVRLVDRLSTELWSSPEFA